MSHHEIRTRESRDDYETPWYIVRAIEDRLCIKFALDPCAKLGTGKAPKVYYSGGLALQWWPFGPVFCNPPYSKVADWMGKASQEGEHTTVVCLVPARTDTQWWHRAVMGWAAEVWLVEGRISFLLGGKVMPNPGFPAAVVIYRPGWQLAPVFSTWKPPPPSDERQVGLFTERVA